MSNTRTSIENELLSYTGEDNDSNSHDARDRNQQDDAKEKVEPHHAIPNYSESQIGMSSQILAIDALSIENQALMRALQAHRFAQRLHCRFGHRNATHTNIFQQDAARLIREVLVIDQNLPQALFERRWQERLDVELAQLAYMQLPLDIHVAVPQDPRFQVSFYERMLRTRTITSPSTTRLLGDDRASVAAALSGTLMQRDNIPAIMSTANDIFLLPSRPLLQTVPLNERFNARQYLSPDSSRPNDLSLSHEETIRPFSDNVSTSTHSSNADPLPVAGPQSFPLVLHRALLALEKTLGGKRIAAFLEDGMSFRIVNRTKFEQQVMVAFFPRMKGYASFQRQLNLYEFRRCMDGRYWHECFIRNDPALLIEMRRTKANRNQSSGEGNNKLSRTTSRNRDRLIAQVMSKETEWWYHCSNHDLSQWFSFRWQTSSCSAKGTIKWQRQLCCSQLSQHNHCQTTERYSEFFV